MSFSFLKVVVPKSVTIVICLVSGVVRYLFWPVQSLCLSAISQSLCLLTLKLIVLFSKCCSPNISVDSFQFKVSALALALSVQLSFWCWTKASNTNTNRPRMSDSKFLSLSLHLNTIVDFVLHSPEFFFF